MFFLLFSLIQFTNLARTALKITNSHWYGRISHSDDEMPSPTVNQAVLECSSLKGESHASCMFKNGTADASMFYIKPDEEDSTIIRIISKVGDDIATVKIYEKNSGETLLMRGVLQPKNDQITISLGYLDMNVGITDQFSSNTTLISLRRASPNLMINNITKIGLFITVFVTILVGLYKAADLSDVIKPEEGKTAMKIKQMSIEADRRKQRAKAKTE